MANVKLFPLFIWSTSLINCLDSIAALLYWGWGCLLEAVYYLHRYQCNQFLCLIDDKNNFIRNKIWTKPLTVQLIFLVIISRSFCSTFNSFYLPAPIVVFDHMCLLLGSFFCKTETEATHKKEEEEEKMCERLFHVNNCRLCQKCPVSYSVLTAILLNHAFVYATKWYVSRAAGWLVEGKKRTQKKTHLLPLLTQADAKRSLRKCANVCFILTTVYVGWSVQFHCPCWEVRC